jgi:glutamate formiminotransferase
MLECVVNVSEGRDRAVLDVLAASCEASLLDLHVDADHHRSVFTLAGPGASDAVVAVRALAEAVARHVDISTHEGVHPRMGALDVVPFVALGPTRAEAEQAIAAARDFAQWWAEAWDVPVFLYDEAEPSGRDLPYVRRHAFKSRQPDFGPPQPHPRLGVTAVGARKPLVAVNCVLVARDVELARRIARQVREADGGLRGVRALGFMIDAIDRPQVSMNLVELEHTGIEDACLRVRDLARRAGSDVAEVELVGLLPAAELDRCTERFLAWSGLDASSTVEGRILEKEIRSGPTLE